MSSNKKFLYIVKGLVASFFLAFMICLNSTNVKAEENPVQLYYSEYDRYGSICKFDGVDVYIAVKNLGCNKKVKVHYSINNQNIWRDKSAKFVKSNKDGYELWYCNIADYTPGNNNYKFSISYEVNGNIYWDNNRGKNYINTELGKSDLYGRMESSGSGIVILKKLFKNNKVNIVYTYDNWNTYKEVAATYDKDFKNNLEKWNFNIPNEKGQLKYAVYYQVNGKTYWDNNFDENYPGNKIYLNGYLRYWWGK